MIASGSANVGRITAERSPPDHAFVPRRRPGRIHDEAVTGTGPIGVGSVPVRSELPDVPEHVLKPEGVGCDERRRLRSPAAVPAVDDEAVEHGRVAPEHPVPPPPLRVFCGITAEEVRTVPAAAGGVLPLGLGRQTIVLAGHLREPATILLRSVMRHRDGRTVTLPPPLIGRHVRRRGPGDGVHPFRLHQARVASPLGPRGAVPGLEFVPRDLDTTHPKGVDRDEVSRTLVRVPIRLLVGTAHAEGAARNRDHLERHRRAGDVLGVVGEAFDDCRGLVHLGTRGRDQPEVDLLRIGIEVADLHVALDAGNLVDVVLVVEVGLFAFVGQLDGVQVRVAGDTRLGEHERDGVLELRPLLPVEAVLLLEKRPKDVADAQASLVRRIGDSTGRQVTLDAPHHRAAFRGVVGGQPPRRRRLRVYVAGAAEAVGRRRRVGPADPDDQHDPGREPPHVRPAEQPLCGVHGVREPAHSA